MTEEQTLLRGVLANPDDELIRLVYADAIQESHPERAAIIRAMIALSGDSVMEGRMSKPEYDATDLMVKRWLTNRGWGRELEQIFGWNWAYRQYYSFLQFDSRTPSRCIWRRGFVEEIEPTLAVLDAHASKLFASHPIRRVKLVDRHPLEFDSRWLWHNGDHGFTSGGDEPDHVPAMLFNHLAGYIPRPGKVTDAVRGYLSLHEAMDAMSAACISNGRRLAGLGQVS